MPTKLTKQGVRDLNPSGFSGHRATRTYCRHNFNATLQIIGYDYAYDEDVCSVIKEPVYGERCLLCGETRV